MHGTGLCLVTLAELFMLYHSQMVSSDLAVAAVAQVLKKIAGIYVNTTQNPFHVFGQPLTSLRFEQQIDAVVLAFGQPPSLALSYMTI